jgi:hypothetical protein
VTTLVLQLTPTMARRVAKASDILALPSHEDVALQGLGLFLDSILGRVRGRKPSSRAARLQRQRRARRVA